ncbi:MAG: hypothetical protein GYA21_01395 [Myxococcales bacterium]|nr:hypothetical protein [Myxococcales bacterium]
MMMVQRLSGMCLAALLFASCGEGIEETDYYGEFDLVTGEGKEDGLGAPAVPLSADSAETAVWEVRNQWADRDTTEARKAGLAWGANSGLDWNQKYALWLESLPRIQGENGYTTFSITNPQGKTLPAPALECAEVAYFLRATFASWYGLPFFIEAVDAKGQRVFFGHFGWRTANGRYLKSPLFRSWYKDYSKGSYTAANWPRDEKLRAKKLYGNQDDFQPFLGVDAHAGTYFDEMFLNKRVGHFLILFLSNFGSIHLADSSNTFNLKPEAIQPGDVLLERWQRRGIGHTLNVKTVEPGTVQGTLVAELASGSMPRRQPKWEGPVDSKRYFTSQECGGSELSSDGVPYAQLGGGLKRWRIAVAKNGSYLNTVPDADRANWISSTNYSELGARPERFRTLLEEPDPALKREALLQAIESARAYLREHPASCSARTNREKAFAELYALNQESFYISREETDRRYRSLEDYVFAELDYPKSKTCCWNTTTAAMAQIVLDYNRSIVKASPSCVRPVVFMNDNGYQAFADYAAQTGHAADWKPWSEDEPCSQRGVTKDTEAAHAWTDFCDIASVLLGSSGCTDDGFERNNTLATAAALEAGTQSDLMLCPGDEDYFQLSTRVGTVRATIQFSNAAGDLDLELLDGSGASLSRSTGSGDSETVQADLTAAGTVIVRVYGYRGASAPYSLSVVLP